MKASVCCVYFYNTVVSCILVLLSGLAKAYKSLTWFRAKCILRIPLHKMFQNYWKSWCSKICYTFLSKLHSIYSHLYFMIGISYRKGHWKFNIVNGFLPKATRTSIYFITTIFLQGNIVEKGSIDPAALFSLLFPSSSVILVLSKNDCFCKLTQHYISDKGAERT